MYQLKIKMMKVGIRKVHCLLKLQTFLQKKGNMIITCHLLYIAILHAISNTKCKYYMKHSNIYYDLGDMILPLICKQMT